MLLAIPRPALVGLVEGNPHDVRSGADQDGQQAVAGPPDLKGVLHGCCQAGQQLRQPAAQGLRDEQRRPDYGDIEKQVKDATV